MVPEYVISSNIDCLGYDHGNLFIRFRNGHVYKYPKVAPSVYHALKDSESVGKSFHSLIRGKYEYEQLAVDPFVAPMNTLLA